MALIWTPAGAYFHTAYRSEADLENAILQVQSELLDATVFIWTSNGRSVLRVVSGIFPTAI